MIIFFCSIKILENSEKIYVNDKESKRKNTRIHSTLPANAFFAYLKISPLTTTTTK